jgi:apolipoprotein N-acyltransferase
MSSFKLWKSKKIFILPIISGIILTLTLIYSELFFLLFFFLVPFLVFIEEAKNKKEAFVGGFLMSFIYFIYSLFIVLWPSQEFSNLLSNYQDLELLKGNFFLLTLFLILSPIVSLIYGFFALGTFFAFNLFKDRKLYLFILVPLFWIITEFLKRKIFFDLSWGDIGYNLVDFTFFVNTAKIWGRQGLAFLIIVFNLLIYFIFKRKINLIKGVVLLIFISISVSLLGFYLIKQTYKSLDQKYKIKIAVLQGYIPWTVSKYWPDRNEPFTFPSPYDKLLEKLPNDLDIILLPEEVLNFNPIEISTPGFPTRVLNDNFYFSDEKRQVMEILKKTGAKIFIIGQPVIFDRNLFGNSFLIFDNKGNVGSYVKKRLFPLVEKPVLHLKLKYFTTDYTQGSVSPFMKIRDNFIIFLSNCIEIESDDLSNKFLGTGPSIILNGGSEIGFREYAQRYQLKLARFRAVEQDKFLATAKKAGYSAIIDPTGKVLKISNHTREDNFLIEEVYLKAGKTFYSKIGKFNNLIFSILSLLFFIFIIYAKRLLKKSEHTSLKLKEE